LNCDPAGHIFAPVVLVADEPKTTPTQHELSAITIVSTTMIARLFWSLEFFILHILSFDSASFPKPARRVVFIRRTNAISNRFNFVDCIIDGDAFAAACSISMSLNESPKAAVFSSGISNARHNA
jgi:hypothetical protein